MTSPPWRRRLVLMLPSAFLASASLAGCTSQDAPVASLTAASPAATPPATIEPPAPGEVVLPDTHVHGAALDPVGGVLYLATHEGLLRYDDGGAPELVGPVIDLMGFTAVGPDHFYASGHPGPGVELPEPLGLIESTDGGRTWSLLSRQGQSDFHALAASDSAVLGYDGEALRRTTDGRTWTELDPPMAPYSLAVAPDGEAVLATSESGPVRSTDGGQTWATVEGAPLLQLVHFAGATTVVGVAPDGVVAVSEDSGATWTGRGSVGSAPQALTGHVRGDGSLHVVVVTGDGVLSSTDGGSSFVPFVTG